MALPLYDTVLTEEYLRREYVEKGRGSTAIGLEVGANPATVRNYLIRYAIARRGAGRSPAARTYAAVDASGFSQPTTEAHAYWIGFLTADGSVQGPGNLVRLKLAAIDAPHVVAWGQFVGTAAPVRIVQQGTAAYVDVSSRELVTILAHWGIVRNKTLTLPFPNHMPSPLLPAYIRGYFDGDGTIMWRDRTSPTSHWREVVLRFTSGSMVFLDGLRQALNGVGIETNKPYSNGGNTYVLPIAGRKDNARRFAVYLYTDATVYLGRKHLAFTSLLGGEE